jgi:hypothetical protein
MSESRVQIRLDLTTTDRQRLRIIAAHKDISMAEFARQAVKVAMEQAEQEHKRMATAKILRNKRDGTGETFSESE